MWQGAAKAGTQAAAAAAKRLEDNPVPDAGRAPNHTKRQQIRADISM